MQTDDLLENWHMLHLSEFRERNAGPIVLFYPILLVSLCNAYDKFWLKVTTLKMLLSTRILRNVELSVTTVKIGLFARE